jgi:hypothetical protein
VHVKTDEEWRLQKPELLAALGEFGARLRDRPFDNEQGLRGVSAFALYWFTRSLDPALVFEVGVWRGFSTWIIEQAAPQAQLHCLDPVFMFEPYLRRRRVGRTYRSPRASYSSQDFSCVPVAELAVDRPRTLVFFDDHQNKLPRLRQCHAAGVEHVVFDDNRVGVGTHRTLEDERRTPAGTAELERLVERYETFPALWPVRETVAGLPIDEAGLDFPVEPAFAAVHAERRWHSNVTYARLRPEDPD